MPKLRQLSALVLARAMLAEPDRSAPALRARMARCLATDPAWLAPLAECCAAQMATPQPSLRRLATLIAADPDFEPSPPRHYLLSVADEQAPPPPALAHCALPALPHSAALAEFLGISAAGLWRLTRPSAWQRREPLAEQHYRCRLLAKRSGGWRLLEVPEPYLMALQRRVLSGLLDRLPPHPAACGFAPGRSVLDHARAHEGQAVVLSFDLQDFFASVRAARVQALFATLGYADEVARLLSALCCSATPEPVLSRLRQEGGLSWQQCQRLRDAHLPQGAPSSPALANLCAFGLDRRLAGLARALGARYSRYADDLVLSGPASLQAARPRIEAWVGRIAIEQGLALNHRKTRCQTRSRRQSVCNIVVNQRSNLPRAEFDRLKAQLHGCVRHGPASQNREGHADWQAHLRGRLAWATQLNAQKAQRLWRLYERIDWTTSERDIR